MAHRFSLHDRNEADARERAEARNFDLFIVCNTISQQRIQRDKTRYTTEMHFHCIHVADGGGAVDRDVVDGECGNPHIYIGAGNLLRLQQRTAQDIFQYGIHLEKYNIEQRRIKRPPWGWNTWRVWDANLIDAFLMGF